MFWTHKVEIALSCSLSRLVDFVPEGRHILYRFHLLTLLLSGFAVSSDFFRRYTRQE